MRKDKKYYVDPIELSCAIVEMHDLSCMTDKFASMLFLIEDHVLNMPRFRNYNEQIKDDLRSFDRFRWTKRGWQTIKADLNPFSYITSGCVVNCLQELKRQFTTQNRYMEFCRKICEENGIDYDRFIKPDTQKDNKEEID